MRRGGGSAPGARSYAWIGEDPERIERAHVALGERGMRAIGGTQASTFVSAWELDVADGWITRALRVTTRGYGWSRQLDLRRGDDGRWTAAASGTGPTDLPAPGLSDASALDGAIDCDLGLCPVTNTMPIRRLGLLESEAPERVLVMAWVEVPSLRVIRSEQRYASAPESPAGVRRVAYASASRDFEATLDVDEDGVVLDYPGLARRVRHDETGPGPAPRDG